MRLRSVRNLTIITLSSAALVSAITFGLIDTANVYRNTGAFLVKSKSTGHIFPLCTGTLIAPDAFLTASHCTVYFEQNLTSTYDVFVSFDNPIPFGDLTTPATQLIPVTKVITNPLYSQRQGDPGDIGLLLVDPANTGGIPSAQLPTAGLLDQMHSQNGLRNAVFTAVGYGSQDRSTGGGQPTFQDDNPVPRRYAFSSFNALDPGYLRLSQNPSKGDGGTCYGDSGGPNFLSTSSGPILAAITITGDNVCRATNVTYRLDTAAARKFLSSYVTLP